MNTNNYLEEYQKTNSRDLYRGPGGWFRRLLDNRAVSLQQADRHALFMKRVLSLVAIAENEPINVLDIGCGDGKAISYQSPSIAYYAIDRGDVYRTRLESRGVQFQIVDVEMNRLPYEDDLFDVVMLNHLIEHIANYDGFLTELRRVIKPGRYLYIRTPDIERQGFNFWNDYTHVHPFTQGALNTMMQAYGFRCHRFLHSDHPRINLDIITDGKYRNLLCGRRFGGGELEAAYVKQ